MTLFSGKYSLNIYDLGKAFLITTITSGWAALAAAGADKRMPTQAELATALSVGLLAGLGVLTEKFFKAIPSVIGIDPSKTTVIDLTAPPTVTPVSATTVDAPVVTPVVTDQPVVVNTTDAVVVTQDASNTPDIPATN